MTQHGGAGEPPTYIGEYAVRRILGEGGMGVVYDATERLSGRRVALKVLQPNLLADDDARRRFLVEMRVMANLVHPNIVRSLASFESEGRLVLVLEHLDGHTLADELARGPLEPGRALEIARALASALAAAHGHDPPIVHRDLKPENVMLLRDGSVKIMDFGIAKVLAPGAGKTLHHQVVGTVLYMSPEQAKAREITPKTDLYALGLVLYEMLAGRSPFLATTVIELLRQQCEIPPAPLSESLRARLPAGLERLLLQLLEKDPAKRPPDALAVEAGLRTLAPPAPWVITQHSTTGAHTPLAAAGLGPQVPRLDTVALLAKFEQPRRLGWLALAIAIGLALVLVPVVLWSTRSGTSPTKPRASSVSSASARAEPAFPDPHALACPPSLTCAPFAPPDPTAVDAQLILDETTRLALRELPGASLIGATFQSSVRDGRVDLTVAQPLVSVELQEGGAAVMIMVQREELRLMRVSPRPGAKPQAKPCPLATLWAVARARRPAFGPGVLGSASLTSSPHDGSPMWIATVELETLVFDARTCELSPGQR